MSAPTAIPAGVRPELGWAAIMKWYFTGGYSQKLGPYATTTLMVLASHADLSTGEVSGLTVIDIGKMGRMGKMAVVAAIAALREVGWLDEIPRRPGQRARYRLRYRAGLLDAEGRQIAEASWPHVPATSQADREAVKNAHKVRTSRPNIKIEINHSVTINQHVEAGGVGVVVLPPPIDQDALALAVEIIDAASAEQRLAWWRRAREAGAPQAIDYRQTSGWAPWVARAVIDHAT